MTDPVPPPKVYRVMRRDPADGLPVVGQGSSSELGVRPGYDIMADATGAVLLDSHGMSVVPSWRVLKVSRIPRRLHALVRGAFGSNNSACYSLGSGPFVRGEVAPRLELIPDPGPAPVRHGVVAPLAAVPVAEYQADIASTRGAWRIDEV